MKRTAVLFLTLFFCSGCSPRATIVQVAQIEQGDLEGHFVASGRVHGATVKIAPQILGRVRAIPVKENQSVSKGQVLVRFDDGEQKAHVAALRSQLEIAKAREAEYQRQLVIKQGESQAQVMRAGATRSEAQWRLQETLQGSRVEEIRQAELDVRAAEVEEQRTRSERSRFEQLLSEDVAAQVEVERAEASHHLAEARLKQARERLLLLQKGPRKEQRQVARSQVQRADADVLAARTASLELEVLQQRVRAGEADVRNVQGQVREAEISLEKMTIKSPQAGIVNQIKLEVGDVARSGDPVMNLIVPTRLWIEAHLDEQDAAYIAKGQPVGIQFSAIPGKQFAGVVEEVSPSLERQEGTNRSRALPCRIKLATSVPGLLPGLEADVEGRRKIAQRTLLVPRSALLRGEKQGGNDSVFVVEGGVAHRRGVQVQGMTSDRVALSSGVEAGATVIVGGLDAVQDGSVVRAQP